MKKIDEKSAQELTKISKKKPSYSIKRQLRQYLRYYGRETKIPLGYDDLMNYSQSFPLIDKNGKDTLWETVIYDSYLTEEMHKGLSTIYALLKNDGDLSVTEHLFVARVDYCTFGNSNPFRIRIVNQFNDNYDYIYIKKADASRVYGLELEHILSPNRISYLVHQNTLVEEHIAGIPGDDFIIHYLERPEMNKVRIAKEFVKFNERCFVRLLGDMRAYNFVIDITPDFEDTQYRIRPIDFDQQSFEGKKTLYLPQFYKENNPFVNLCIDLLNPETIKQYQNEERTLILRRLKAERYMIKDLIDVMRQDEISTPEKIEQLKQELMEHHNQKEFLEAQSMGDLVRLNLKHTLPKSKSL